ncbi:MAG: OmpA family protein [Deltaproteobacteria bacterium]|nr:OmpA family protein [Deltaproteobacteria bacterium]
MENKNPIIIKKIKKGGGGGHHGGSWKVAYADFVTAMMAFFLLMWLINATPQEKKEELANYFQNYSLFEEGSGASKKVPLDTQDSAAISVSPTPPSATGSSGTEDKSPEVQELQKQLEEEIEQKLSDVKDQIIIGTFKGGVKVDIMDKNNAPMFPSGSTKLTDSGKRIIGVIAENLKTKKNRLEIEGHTDAKGYSNKDFSNWELSTARASSARIEMESHGIDPARLLRVSGYAATEPIIKEDPYDPRNRRISLRLYP